MERTQFLPVLCFCLAAAAAPPDRPPEPGEWGYRPGDGARVKVNPPPLTWVQHSENARYELQWASTPEFGRPETIRDIPWSVYTHTAALPPGTYNWRYRAFPAGQAPTEWSRARRFTIPEDAAAFPRPTADAVRASIPEDHPRLFVTPETLAGLKAHANTAGQEDFVALRAAADRLLHSDPTPEPTVMASIRDPETGEHWWPNRLQTLKACQEAEVLAFTFLLTGEDRYGRAARRWVLHLTEWDPDGPTNWKLNDEAAMPILHRLARAYDWAFEALTEEDRRMVRAALLRRAQDAWRGYQTLHGAGHLNRPYNSHGNRSWHKLAENAIATFGETAESELYLRFAIDKFYAAYPVWSDDDGGWHEGLNYWAGYMSKVTWWLDVAEHALGIDGFRKPFFANIGDYALYTAPPGSPDVGFGDLAFRPPSAGWSFFRFFISATGNPYWAWWADRWKIEKKHSEPVMQFLWGARPVVAPRAPRDLPASKVFEGTGVAVLNTSLLDSSENVQIRFKSSPFGRQSHGHEPHNSFTLNAYGEQLLVNNVYRDVYGSPFHSEWCWSTRSQNALLVNGGGQKRHSPDPYGEIVASDFQEGADYVAGDAAAAYEGALRHFRRHVVFVKPGLIIIADEIEAGGPATFQWMLHAQQPFEVDEKRARLTLDRSRAGLVVDYGPAPARMRMRQLTGYEPPPDAEYLRKTGRDEIPAQWHVEAEMESPDGAAFVLTVLRPYRAGQRPTGGVEYEASEESITVRAPVEGDGLAIVRLNRPGSEASHFAAVRTRQGTWRLGSRAAP